MSEVTVIGCGAMGSALARSFLAAGHCTSVWNRTAAKLKPLVEAGAVATGSLGDALARSPTIVVCVADYSVTRELLEPELSVRSPQARDIVQLSTGTPAEARSSKIWIEARGGKYLDGAILEFPEDVGGPSSRLVLSGDMGAWQRNRPLQGALGGGLRYVGDEVGSAAAIDLAFLIQILGMNVGAAHASAICEAEGVGLEHVAELFSPGDFREVLDVIRTRQFANPGAPVDVWRHALQRITEHASGVSIGAQVPDFIGALMDETRAAGHGDEHIAALYKVIRQRQD